MHVQIYSLKKTLFDGEAESLNCETKNGQITVLDNHKPIISILRPGVIKTVDKAGKEAYINVSSGFLEVKSGNITRLLVEES